MFQIIHVSIGNVIFNVAMLAYLGLIGAFRHDIRTGKDIFDFSSHRVMGFTDHVFGSGMDLSRSFGQCRLRRHQRLIGLVLNINQFQRLLRDEVVFSDRHSDLVTPVTDLPGQQQPVCHIFVRSIQRIRMAGGGKFVPGNIFIGVHGFDPGQTFGPAGANFPHAAMGDGAAQIFGHQHPRNKKIIGITCPAGNLGHRINSFDGLTNCHWKCS